jgi:uncharacterized Zn-finger protein
MDFTDFEQLFQTFPATQSEVSPQSQNIVPLNTPQSEETLDLNFADPSVTTLATNQPRPSSDRLSQGNVILTPQAQSYVSNTGASNQWGSTSWMPSQAQPWSFQAPAMNVQPVGPTNSPVPAPYYIQSQFPSQPSNNVQPQVSVAPQQWTPPEATWLVDFHMQTSLTQTPMAATPSPANVPTAPPPTAISPPPHHTQHGTSGKRKKLVRCQVCGTLCKRPSGLIQHLRTHTGEKPFVCPVPDCQQAFSVKSNMVRHFKTLHREWDLRWYI